MIEAVSEENLDEIFPLIRQYQEFYKVDNISESRNRDFFSQFGGSDSSGSQFLFRENGNVVGFATVYFSYTSTIAAKIGVLSDLYTLPSTRGKGIGRQLVEHCRQYAADKGAVRLQWVTAPDNESAKRLYDSMETNKSTWLFYTYNT